MVNTLAHVNISAYGNNSGAIAYVDIVFACLGIVALNKNIVSVCSSENGTNALGSSLRLFGAVFLHGNCFNSRNVSRSINSIFFNWSSCIIGRSINYSLLNRYRFIGRCFGNIFLNRCRFVSRSLGGVLLNRRSIAGRCFSNVLLSRRFRFRLFDL